MKTSSTIAQQHRIRGPWVEIDLGALEENIRVIRDALGTGPEIMFVVKANAYGHGAVPVARRAYDAGVKWFAVAYLHEALELRTVLPDANILVLGVVDPADVPCLLQHRIIPIIVSESHGLALGRAAEEVGGRLTAHLKVDTGMARLGIPWEEAASSLRRLCEVRGLDVQGLCSHFATVEPGRPELADAQYERFCLVAEASPRPLFKHLSSSRAFLYHREWDLDAVRPGIALFGYGTGESEMRFSCRPILQWKTTVTQVKQVAGGVPIGYYGTYVTPCPTTLGILAVGYADGYLRTLSNRAHVLIRGRRYQVVGRVTMNWLTVDLGRETDIRPGEDVVLIGEQDDEAIWASELAAQCRTIAYEILTMINPAIERKYV